MQNLKAFSILELLVVIAIIAIISVFGYPKVDQWLTDREVKKDLNAIKAHIEEIKSDIDAKKYSFAIIHFVPTPALWIMDNEEWALQMKNPAPNRTYHSGSSPKSFLNNSRVCPGSFEGFISQDKMRMTKNTSKAFKWPGNINWSPNMHICISKDSILTQYGSGGENMPHLSGKAGFLVCSNTNTDREGSNRCHYNQSVNKKLKYLYAIRVNRNYTVEIIKFNEKNSSWTIQ